MYFFDCDTYLVDYEGKLLHLNLEQILDCPQKVHNVDNIAPEDLSQGGMVSRILSGDYSDFGFVVTVDNSNILLVYNRYHKLNYRLTLIDGNIDVLGALPLFKENACLAIISETSLYINYNMCNHPIADNVINIDREIRGDFTSHEYRRYGVNIKRLPMFTTPGVLINAIDQNGRVVWYRAIYDSSAVHVTAEDQNFPGRAISTWLTYAVVRIGVSEDSTIDDGVDTSELLVLDVNGNLWYRKIGSSDPAEDFAIYFGEPPQSPPINGYFRYHGCDNITDCVVSDTSIYLLTTEGKIYKCVSQNHCGLFKRPLQRRQAQLLPFTQHIVEFRVLDYYVIARTIDDELQIEHRGTVKEIPGIRIMSLTNESRKKRFHTTKASSSYS